MSGRVGGELAILATGLTLKIVDAKGKPLHAETKKIKGAIAVRTLPPKTGSYAVIFTITSTDVQKPSWALAYAYR